MANYGYDKNTDYTKLINEAVQRQDYRSAATYEQQRNEKIRGEGLTQYQTTSHYADYLPRREQINSGMDKMGKSEWDYELDKDPAWKAYRKQYLREADRGTRDTMAAAASMTGGVPSTAAVQAGQQAGNYYRSQLTDKIPELMQNDYSRYMQGREADRADLNLLFNIDEQRQQDSWQLQDREYERQNNAWQQAMNRWAVLGYADQAVADALGVPVGTSTQDAAYQQKQLEYQQWQRQQNERGDAYDRALTQINMGIVPDAATLQAAGLDAAAARAMVAKVLQQMRYSGGSSGGRSGGTRTVYVDRPTVTEDDLDGDDLDEEPPVRNQNTITAAQKEMLYQYGKKNGPDKLLALMRSTYAGYTNYNDVLAWLNSMFNGNSAIVNPTRPPRDENVNMNR